MRSSSDGKLSLQQHLGPDATRIMLERNLALPVQNFDVKGAHIQTNQDGAYQLAGPEWQALSAEFPATEAVSRNEVIVGGE